MSELLAILSSPTGILVSIAAGMLLMYFARHGAHELIHSVFRLLYGSFRLGARALAVAGRGLNERNREVLLALGKEQAERELNREFFRINKFVERDLGGYPRLQRSIEDGITLISEDYHRAGEVPPPSPEWVEAVESVAKLQTSQQGESLTQRILKDIHSTSEAQHRESLQAYRKSVAERHSILKQIAPYWRKLSNDVGQVGSHLQELIERGKVIDQKMDRFEEICAKSDKAERTLKASQVTQFLIALFVLTIAVGGAVVNFHLIEFPMREMVDASNRIFGIRVSEVAAFVLILLEITLGIFLMEALHITRLFPLIGSMDDRMRIKGIWAVATMLIIFATMEAGLAFMRDYLQADNYALRAELADTTGEVTWITLAVNMGMGFFIPLILAVVAIPLEYLFHTGRTVVGMLLELLVGILTVAMRLLANAVNHLGKMVIALYDIVIMLPLWVEKTIKAVAGRGDKAVPASNQEPSDQRNLAAPKLSPNLSHRATST